MDRAELDRLLAPRLLSAVAAEADGPAADPLARTTALRAAGFSPAEATSILTQAALRRRARLKFGEFADRMLFTRAGLEQATRLPVAIQHAARFRRAGVAAVADLGCGIGGDSLAFAGAGLAVLAVEHDPITADLARHNLAPFPDAGVLTGDAEVLELPADAGAWLDPARRTAGHDGTRRVAAAAGSPSVGFALRTAAVRPTGIKLSPAHDRTELPADLEAQWVSHRGEVVELALWSGPLARAGVRRSALLVAESGVAELTADADSDDEPVGPVGAYLHEPDGAVIRARLIGDLARATGTHPVGPGIAYLSGDSPASSPFLDSFEVLAALPFDRTAIRTALRARSVGRLEIKKRGVDLDPAAFRRGLGLAGDEEAVLIVTRTVEGRRALLCRRA